MKVLHLSWSERLGGAARAAYRLNAALNQSGVRSTILSAAGYLDEAGSLHPASEVDRLFNRVSARLDQLPLIRYRDREKSLFSATFAPDRINKLLASRSADLLHLHWINNGFMKIETLPKLKQPVVWTLHDMWPFTGGCHYSNGCKKFTEACGSCPQLHSDCERDLSYKTLLRKKIAWSQSAINVVTPSRWLADTASSSAILRQSRISTIPNAIDLDAFAPADRRTARAEFGLPDRGVILLFGALTGDGEKRKGFHFMGTAVSKTGGGVHTTEHSSCGPWNEGAGRWPEISISRYVSRRTRRRQGYSTRLFGSGCTGRSVYGG